MRLNFGPQDIVGIVKRRFFWALIPFLAVATACLAVIHALPSLYQSEATLIVQDQQVRNDFVSSAVSSNTLTLLEQTSARVTARDRLNRIVTDMNLFDDNSRQTLADRSEKLAENLTIDINRTESRSRRRGDPSSILLSIGFRHEAPEIAQRVTNRLVTEFQETYVTQRRAIAGNTTDYLQRDVESVTDELTAVQESIAAIKNEDPQALPELRDINQRALERYITEQARLDNAVELADQELRLLQLQSPLYLEAEDATSTDEQLLRSRRRDLDALQREYLPNHPDVIALRAEVLDLERDIDPAAFRRSAAREIESLNRQISDELRGSAAYRQLEARREQLQVDLDTLPAGSNSTPLSEVQYTSQLETLETRIASLRRQRDNAASEIVRLEQVLGTTASVAARLSSFEQREEELQRELTTRRNDLSDAQRSQNLEQDALAESLEPLNQANRPQDPVSPNRPQLAFLGFGVAGLLAGLVAMFPEIFSPRIFGRHHLKEFIGDIKVVEVPRFETDIVPRQKMFKWIVSVCISIVLGLALLFWLYLIFI